MIIMKKIYIFLSILILLFIAWFSYKYFIYDSKIHFKDSIVLRVINNDETLSKELSKTSISHYNKLITEANNIYYELYKNWCKTDENKVILLSNNLRFLKEHNLAISVLKNLYNCNKKLYNWINESSFNLLSNLGLITQDSWNKKWAIDIYNQILKRFSWNKFPYFSLSQEEQLKEEVKRLEK